MTMLQLMCEQDVENKNRYEMRSGMRRGNDNRYEVKKHIRENKKTGMVGFYGSGM